MTRGMLNLVPVTDPSAATPAPASTPPAPPGGDETADSTLAQAEAGSGESSGDTGTARDQPTSAPGPTTPAASTQNRRRRGAGARAGGEAAPTTAWREWGSFDRTVSYRLPGELIDELDQRMWELRIRERGSTIAAAITQLLDLDDERLLAVVERAHAAKPTRRATGPR